MCVCVCVVELPTLQWPNFYNGYITSLYIPVQQRRASIMQYVLYTTVCPAMGVIWYALIATFLRVLGTNLLLFFVFYSFWGFKLE